MAQGIKRTKQTICKTAMEGILDCGELTVNIDGDVVDIKKELERYDSELVQITVSVKNTEEICDNEELDGE